MKYFLIAILASIPLFTAAQSGQPAVVDTKKHKVVMQLTSGDTLVQKSLIKQVQNLLTAAPNSRIEVVCHNSGISLLQTAQTKHAAGIAELSKRGVDFVACENTMRERKIPRSELLAAVRTVPAGILEVVLKQEKGWSYVRAGQ